MFRAAKTCLGVATGMLVMGCGGSPGLALNELTLQEAEELAAATMFATFDVTSVVPPRPSLPLLDAAPAGWLVDFEADVRCPAVGRVGLAVSALVHTGVGGGERVDYDLTQVHDGCGVQRSDDGRFTVSGSPRSTASASVLHDGFGRITWSGAAGGEVRWRQAERGGACTFDVTFSGRSDERVATATVTGSMCGQPIDLDFGLR